MQSLAMIATSSSRTWVSAISRNTYRLCEMQPTTTHGVPKHMVIATSYASMPEDVLIGPVGAPETQRANSKIEQCKLKIRQDVDIWSMGCVYSEVATWVDQGWNKVVEYRRRRAEEMKQKKGRKQDSFHDGHSILDAVRQIHHDIVHNRRMNDYVTPEVVTQLINEMLLVKASRPDAKYLYDKSKRILDDAQARLDEIPTFTPTPSDERRAPVEPAPSRPPTHERQDSGDSISGGPPINGVTPQRSETMPYNNDRGQVASNLLGRGGLPYSPNQSQYYWGDQPNTNEGPQNEEQAESQSRFHDLDRNSAYRFTNQRQPRRRGPADESLSLRQPNYDNEASTQGRNGASINPSDQVSHWTKRPGHPSQASISSESIVCEGDSLHGTPGRDISGSATTTLAGPTTAERSYRNEDSLITAMSGRKERHNSMPHPHLNVEEGLHLKWARENGKKLRFDHEELFESLKLRDHVSMSKGICSKVYS